MDPAAARRLHEAEVEVETEPRKIEWLGVGTVQNRLGVTWNIT